jgi:putative hydrolases of HD superfamily
MMPKEYRFMPNTGEIHRIIEFILELDKLKMVTRKSRPLGLERFENSAEHSWQIALLAASMTSFAVKPVDINRVIGMLLVHDIGEIDTGDTIVYAEDGWEEIKEAEKAAVSRIFGILPEPQQSQFMSLWMEFEQVETEEARFAHALDRAMPALLNLANNGQSWRENNISYERVIKRIGPPIQAGCPALWEELKKSLDEAYSKGWFGENLA